MVQPSDARSWPLLSTALVALAVLAMIALGFWQLERRDQKERAIALFLANMDKPATSYPQTGPVAPEVMFRASSVQCLNVEGWDREAGRATDGSAGYRYIAQCRTGAEGQGALIAIGVSARPDLVPAWRGGVVKGHIVEEPDHRSLLGHLTGPQIVLRPMLIATRSPDPGLKDPAAPQVESIPNNHLVYAVQWFAFALIAVVIYGIALFRRFRPATRDS